MYATRTIRVCMVWPSIGTSRYFDFPATSWSLFACYLYWQKLGLGNVYEMKLEWAKIVLFVLSFLFTFNHDKTITSKYENSFHRNTKITLKPDWIYKNAYICTIDKFVENSKIYSNNRSIHFNSIERNNKIINFNTSKYNFYIQVQIVRDLKRVTVSTNNRCFCLFHKYSSKNPSAMLFVNRLCLKELILKNGKELTVYLLKMRCSPAFQSVF